MSRLMYRQFRAASGLRYWLGRRCTPGGLLLLAGLVASTLTGVDTTGSLTYQLFALLLALLVVAMACNGRFRVPLTARRALPPYGTVGQPLAYRILVHNAGGRAQRGLVLFDSVADPRPSFEEFRGAREPGEARRNRFDRALGYHRWAWLLARNQRAVTAEHVLPILPPNGTVEIPSTITPLRRGYLRLTEVMVGRTDPFGLFKAFVPVPAPQSVLVLPRRYPVPALQLPGSRRYQHGGIALASSAGDSEEFVSLREYRPGDPLRRIHWRSWARAGKPIVKEYQDEFFVRHALVLDTFLEAEHSELLEEAVSVAASLACTIQTQESLLDLLFVGPQAYCFTFGRGVGHAAKMLEILACVRACRDKPFATLHRSVIVRRGSLSGCICILLAWGAERRGLVQHLRSLEVPTLVLVITDPAAPAAPAPDAATGAMAWLHTLEVGRIAEGLARL